MSGAEKTRQDPADRRGLSVPARPGVLRDTPSAAELVAGAVRVLLHEALDGAGRMGVGRQDVSRRAGVPERTLRSWTVPSESAVPSLDGAAALLAPGVLPESVRVDLADRLAMTVGLRVIAPPDVLRQGEAGALQVGERFGALMAQCGSVGAAIECACADGLLTDAERDELRECVGRVLLEAAGWERQLRRGKTNGGRAGTGVGTAAGDGGGRS